MSRRVAPVPKLGSKGRLGKLPNAQVGSRYAFAYPFHPRLEKAMSQVLGSTLAGPVSQFMEPAVDPTGMTRNKLNRFFQAVSTDKGCYTLLQGSKVHEWPFKVVHTVTNLAYKRGWYQALEFMLFVCGGRCRLGGCVVWAGDLHHRPSQLRSLRLLVLQPKPPVHVFCGRLKYMQRELLLPVLYRSLALKSMRAKRTGFPLVSVVREVLHDSARTSGRTYTTALQLVIAWYHSFNPSYFPPTFPPDIETIIGVAVKEGHLTAATRQVIVQTCCSLIKRKQRIWPVLLDMTGDTTRVKSGYDQEGYPWLTKKDRVRFPWPPTTDS